MFIHAGQDGGDSGDVLLPVDITRHFILNTKPSPTHLFTRTCRASVSRAFVFLLFFFYFARFHVFLPYKKKEENVHVVARSLTDQLANTEQSPASFHSRAAVKSRMGEKLELKLKSPVGAEPAGYPWPLPVYVSVNTSEFTGHGCTFCPRFASFVS